MPNNKNSTTSNKVYSLGLTREGKEVIWQNGSFYVGSESVYNRSVKPEFRKVTKSYLAEEAVMSRLTCAGAHLLRSKVVCGKVVSPGCDLADAWYDLNDGLVSFDSSKFTIKRVADKETMSKCELRYIGDNCAHVDIPEGVKNIDHIFSERAVKSCSVPDSVISAYDPFRLEGHVSNEPVYPDGEPIMSLKNGPYYLFEHGGSDCTSKHSSGWVLPEGTTCLGYATEHLSNYDRSANYPIVWYRKEGETPSFHEYSPLRGDNVIDAETACYRMMKFASDESGTGASFTADGIRLVYMSGYGNENEDVYNYICSNVLNAKDRMTNREFYAFDRLEDIDFGDLALNIHNSNGSRGVEAKWETTGHREDGTNLYGRPFSVPEGIVNVDALFDSDIVLKTGVRLPATVKSAEGTYENSLVEYVPDFPPDSKLKNAYRFCFGCSKLSFVPDLPETTTLVSDAFANTEWDNDMPINAKGMTLDTSCVREVPEVDYGLDISVQNLYR